MIPADDKKTEHKRIFAELMRVYRRKARRYSARFESTASDGYLWGWTWWSLPPKMWRIAKTLGFKKVGYSSRYHRWEYSDHQIGDYMGSRSAQDYALKTLEEKYPDSVLLQNISSSGRLD
ncbi:MAG: hypothetical protein A3D65_02455 [Candidatus Lloydbacteria bacterium RIFCSPHIGHO2_02_FULL_50_13]|uniref:Uncharacterized protein n=1 Tax=Candidatus Lloydbacteria bacterium RIFCSPHIGHO2_02_FULL_50_13 TaxID=1798661 RepID=A0A1G2D789_9BACT|nr:MAG: hypothetical protein A3D65_02455 [Candidatus Lloydbacteria bacterium RIFCSPHIGHO2_02_FULL_50_13]